MNRALYKQLVEVLPHIESDERNAYNDPVEAFGDPVAYPDAYVEQTQAIEIEVEGETRISSWLLGLPPRAVLTAKDHVRFDGDIFEVIGEPWRVPAPTRRNRTDHVEARLRLVDEGTVEGS